MRPVTRVPVGPVPVPTGSPWSVCAPLPSGSNKLSGVETAEMEISGLAADIPVLEGQSTIEDLLPGVPGLREAWATPISSDGVPEVAEGNQPALF